MKKSLTIFIVAVMLSSGAVMAQGAGEKNNSFKANPLGLIIGIGKVNYERKLGEASSVQLGASYFNYTSEGSGISGVGFVPEYRFYTGKEAIDGFYVAPFFKYNSVTAKDSEDDFKGVLSWYGGGAKAGCQWLMGKKENFLIDLAFGGKYMDFNLKVKEGNSNDFDNEDLFQGFSPELHFAIGFAF